MGQRGARRFRWLAPLWASLCVGCAFPEIASEAAEGGRAAESGVVGQPQAVTDAEVGDAAPDASGTEDAAALAPDAASSPVGSPPEDAGGEAAAVTTPTPVDLSVDGGADGQNDLGSGSSGALGAPEFSDASGLADLGSSVGAAPNPPSTSAVPDDGGDAAPVGVPEAGVAADAGPGAPDAGSSAAMPPPQGNGNGNGNSDGNGQVGNGADHGHGGKQRL